MRKMMTLGILAILVLACGTAFAWSGPEKRIEKVGPQYVELHVVGMENDGDSDDMPLTDPSVLFSDDDQAYSAYVSEVGGKARLAIYGEFIEQVSNDEAKTITMAIHLMKHLGGGVLDPVLDENDDPMLFDFPFEACEIFPDGYGFRCYTEEAPDPDNQYSQDMAGLFHYDDFYVLFTMGAQKSDHIWARNFSFDITLCDDDTDSDGVPNSLDNCAITSNFAQLDPDGDGIGSACDICPDDSDPLQEDFDYDGIGDACDPCPYSDCANNPPDGDGDGDGDLAEDLGDIWNSGGDEGIPGNVSESPGCSLVGSTPAGTAAYIMIALALIPLAIKRR